MSYQREVMSLDVTCLFTETLTFIAQLRQFRPGFPTVDLLLSPFESLSILGEVLRDCR